MNLDAILIKQNKYLSLSIINLYSLILKL